MPRHLQEFKLFQRCVALLQQQDDICCQERKPGFHQRYLSRWELMRYSRKSYSKALEEYATTCCPHGVISCYSLTILEQVFKPDTFWNIYQQGKIECEDTCKLKTEIVNPFTCKGVKILHFRLNSVVLCLYFTGTL